LLVRDVSASSTTSAGETQYTDGQSSLSNEGLSRGFSV